MPHFIHYPIHGPREVHYVRLPWRLVRPYEETLFFQNKVHMQFPELLRVRTVVPYIDTIDIKLDIVLYSDEKVQNSVRNYTLCNLYGNVVAYLIYTVLDEMVTVTGVLDVGDDMSLYGIERTLHRANCMYYDDIKMKPNQVALSAREWNYVKYVINARRESYKSPLVGFMVGGDGDGAAS